MQIYTILWVWNLVKILNSGLGAKKINRLYFFGDFSRERHQFLN